MAVRGAGPDGEAAAEGRESRENARVSSPSPGPGVRTVATGRVLVEGKGRGPLVRLQAPISFWGGVDPTTGLVADPRHPDHGRSVAGTVLFVPATIGSSSSSAILLELIREGTAPAAILLGRADAILVLGALVARELGYLAPPMVEVAAEAVERLEPGGTVEVTPDGALGPPT